MSPRGLIYRSENRGILRIALLLRDLYSHPINHKSVLSKLLVSKGECFHQGTQQASSLCTRSCSCLLDSAVSLYQGTSRQEEPYLIWQVIGPESPRRGGTIITQWVHRGKCWMPIWFLWEPLGISLVGNNKCSDPVLRREC